MKARLKVQKRDSWWPTNLRHLFKVFAKKGATKHSFACFQYFLSEFVDCIDVDYIICGLRALSAHHSLLLWNKKLCIHSILQRNGTNKPVTWAAMFNEFKINLHKYIRGGMW